MGSSLRVFFNYSFGHSVRNIRHDELQRTINQLNQVDAKLKDMVEKGSLMLEQSQPVQQKLLQKMSSLRRQQVLLELFWREIEGPAFLNCNEHIFEGLSEYKSSQKHQTRIMMSFVAFKRLLAQHPIDESCLQQKGWFVLQFHNFEEEVQVGCGQRVTCQALKGQTFVIDAWDVYGLSEFAVGSAKVSLRMSFVTSGLLAVLKKEADKGPSATSRLSPSGRLEEWFRLWLDFVEHDHDGIHQILLWATPLEKKEAYLGAKKQKVQP